MSEPWGMEWDRHSDMMHLLDTLVALQANKGLHQGHRDWSKRYQARSPSDFMPGDYVRDSQAPREKLSDRLRRAEAAVNGNNNQ